MQIASTIAGGLVGYAVSLFLISNPIGWGTAIVLAVGSTAASYAAGKLARNAYDAFGEVDFVAGTGVDRVCK